MADMAIAVQSATPGGTLLDKKKGMPSWISGVIVAIALLGGLGYIGFHVAGDLGNVTLGAAPGRMFCWARPCSLPSDSNSS
ncbi:MAG TPA: hypothetical protein VGL22_01660 [Terracidiphilus sp.]|jgi:hypothetical protein